MKVLSRKMIELQQSWSNESHNKSFSEKYQKAFTARLSIYFSAKEQSLGRTSTPKSASNGDLASESRLVACR